MKTIYWGIMAIIAAFTATSCTSNAPKNAPQTQNTTQVDSVAKIYSYYGTYEGTLPAADCEGIKTTLTLRADSTYTLISEYLGKSDQPFEYNGVYNEINKDLVELITPSSGEKTYYKVVGEAVALTDSTGKLNEGELAPLYFLEKTSD